MTTASTIASERARVNEEPAVALPWEPGFRSLETEVAAPRELEVQGEMPRELSGVLFRNGAGRHDVYGSRNRSWFDGDGMIHALSIDSGHVTYMNRFVETPGKLAEDRAKKRLYGGFATRPP